MTRSTKPSKRRIKERSRELKKKIATFEGTEKYHITGLPVAEDTFGVEMFIQMAVSSPLAMFIIFVLMFISRN